jgi:hypothetical protein
MMLRPLQYPHQEQRQQVPEVFLLNSPLQQQLYLPLIRGFQFQQLRYLLALFLVWVLQGA